MKKENEQLIWVSKEDKPVAEKLWIISQMYEIGQPTIDLLANLAANARENASKVHPAHLTGAALLSHSGLFYDSCNTEAVTYPETDHAEKSVLARAISCDEIKFYGRKFIRAIAVSHESESGPCGDCRQRIAEYADNCLIFDVNSKGEILKITSLKSLLP